MIQEKQFNCKSALISRDSLSLSPLRESFHIVVVVAWSWWWYCVFEIGIIKVWHHHHQTCIRPWDHQARDQLGPHWSCHEEEGSHDPPCDKIHNCCSSLFYVNRPPLDCYTRLWNTSGKRWGILAHYQAWKRKSCGWSLVLSHSLTHKMASKSRIPAYHPSTCNEAHRLAVRHDKDRVFVMPCHRLMSWLLLSLAEKLLLKRSWSPMRQRSAHWALHRFHCFRSHSEKRQRGGRG